MGILLDQFNEAKKKFDDERRTEDGVEVMEKITKIVNEIGTRFNTLDGGEMAEYQSRLVGYKFYLADYLATLQQQSEARKLTIKEYRAANWSRITEDLKAALGKVSNKEQIENVLTMETLEMQREQVLYETMFYRYRLKMSALDDIITTLVQGIAQKKREVELSRM